MSSRPAIPELQRLNAATAPDFVAMLDGLFEHSTWVAQAAAEHRPFRSLRDLYETMTAGVRQASDARKLALIRAHPELAGKEAIEGRLTEASSGEQARLGLTRLGREDFARLAELNRRYREKFGFPCIVALKLHQSHHSVLDAMDRRIGNGRSEEIATAIEQIGHIVRGRLAQRFGVAGARLSTHVLDTMSGVPGTGIEIELLEDVDGRWQPRAQTRTNDQGRTDQPLLGDIELVPTRYRLQFHIGDYFRRRGVPLAEPAFLDVVPIEFAVADPAGHYHVPLLCTPWSYGTYRGS